MVELLGVLRVNIIMEADEGNGGGCGDGGSYR